MGSSISFIETEKKTWIEHNLKYNQIIREESITLLDKFVDGQEIILGYVDREYCKVRYQHWFITNHVFYLEFGSAENDIYSAIVNINSYPRRFRISKKKEMDEPMRIRMRHVIGMRNYSLCLRNCEHIANYVFKGRWISEQMEMEGSLSKLFRDYLIEDKKRLINSFPETIRPHKMNNTKDKVYDFLERDFVVTNFEYYLDYNENTYNILVIGPTGSGKSRFINVLFNQEICESEQSLQSVTKEIYFIRGQGVIADKGREIIVTDTIGLCDTEWDDDTIINLLKDRVHANMNHLNVVIFIISSDRMLKNVTDNIKKIMNWLNYKANYGRFYFLITRCENTKEDKMEQLKEQLASKLNLKKVFYREKEKLICEKYRIDCVGFIGSEIVNDLGKERIKESVNQIKEDINFASKPFKIKESGYCSIL